jgi:hypothetical protein
MEWRTELLWLGNSSMSVTILFVLDLVAQEAAAVLERKMAAMEALLVSRRNIAAVEAQEEEQQKTPAVAQQLMEQMKAPAAKVGSGPGAGNGYEILLQVGGWV